MSAIRRPDLSRLHSKATVKCECGLVQFQTGTTCRRCGREFEEREAVIELAPEPKPISVIEVGSFPVAARKGRQLSTLRVEEGVRLGIDKQVATVLWLIRVSMDLSQNDVAQQVGEVRQHISRRERGHISPSLVTFEKYCSAFGITPYGLLVIAEAIQ